MPQMQRVNWEVVDDAFKARTVDTLQRFRRGATLPSYATFVTMHVKTYTQSNPHHTLRFLPWHRRFLRRFEEALCRFEHGQDVPAGRKGLLGLPYWDWQAPGWSLLEELPLSGQSTVPGVQAFDPGRWPPYGGRPLRRNPYAQIEVRPLPASDRLAAVLEISDFEEFSANLEAGVRGWAAPLARTDMKANHDTVHDAIGGQMGSAASPDDPVFWWHHTHIDRLFQQWLVRHFDGHGNPNPGTTIDWTRHGLDDYRPEFDVSTQAAYFRYLD